MNLPISAAALFATAYLTLLTVPATAEPTPERQKFLRDLVQNECTRCHGYRRIGQNGPPLTPDIMELKDPDYLMMVILNGRFTQMPPWKGMLSVDDVEFIVGRILVEPAP